MADTQQIRIPSWNRISKVNPRSKPDNRLRNQKLLRFLFFGKIRLGKKRRTIKESRSWLTLTNRHRRPPSKCRRLRPKSQQHRNQPLLRDALLSTRKAMLCPTKQGRINQLPHRNHLRPTTRSSQTSRIDSPLIADSIDREAYILVMISFTTNGGLSYGN